MISKAAVIEGNRDARVEFKPRPKRWPDSLEYLMRLTITNIMATIDAMRYAKDQRNVFLGPFLTNPCGMLVDIFTDEPFRVFG